MDFRVIVPPFHLFAGTELFMEFSFTEVWGRVEKTTGLSTQVEIARKLGFQQASISGAKKRGAFPIEWAVRIAHMYDVSTDWLLTGEGPIKREIAPEPVEVVDIVSHEVSLPEAISTELPYDPNGSFGINELLHDAHRVLTSGNKLAYDALARNIKYFAHAVKTEQRLMDVETRLTEIENLVRDNRQKGQSKEPLDSAVNE